MSQQHKREVQLQTSLKNWTVRSVEDCGAFWFCIDDLSKMFGSMTVYANLKSRHVCEGDRREFHSTLEYDRYPREYISLRALFHLLCRSDLLPKEEGGAFFKSILFNACERLLYTYCAVPVRVTGLSDELKRIKQVGGTKIVRAEEGEE